MARRRFLSMVTAQLGSGISRSPLSPVLVEGSRSRHPPSHGPDRPPLSQSPGIPRYGSRSRASSASRREDPTLARHRWSAPHQGRRRLWRRVWLIDRSHDAARGPGGPCSVAARSISRRSQAVRRRAAAETKAGGGGHTALLHLAQQRPRHMRPLCELALRQPPILRSSATRAPTPTAKVSLTTTNPPPDGWVGVHATASTAPGRDLPRGDAHPCRETAQRVRAAPFSPGQAQYRFRDHGVIPGLLGCGAPGDVQHAQRLRVVTMQ